MSDNRLVSIEIDDETLGASGPEAEHERRVAIFDLIEENEFSVIDHPGGPYRLSLSLKDRKLVFDIGEESGDHIHKFILSMSPFRGVIRDFF
ncbi:MAG: UPF0262 family protein, partial [Pseudomonadota bacterium]